MYSPYSISDWKPVKKNRMMLFCFASAMPWRCIRSQFKLHDIATTYIPVKYVAIILELAYICNHNRNQKDVSIEFLKEQNSEEKQNDAALLCQCGYSWDMHQI